MAGLDEVLTHQASETVQTLKLLKGQNIFTYNATDKLKERLKYEMEE